MSDWCISFIKIIVSPIATSILEVPLIIVCRYLIVIYVYFNINR